MAGKALPILENMETRKRGTSDKHFASGPIFDARKLACWLTAATDSFANLFTIHIEEDGIKLPYSSSRFSCSRLLAGLATISIRVLINS